MCNHTDCITRLRASIEATERVLAELDTRLGPPHECDECRGYGEVAEHGAIVRCAQCKGTGAIGIGAFEQEAT